MNAILMSIQPKWASKILSGEKTIEVRKTAPKPPFKVYVYVTKKGEQLKTRHRDAILNLFLPLEEMRANGRVAFEFVVNKVDRFTTEYVYPELIAMAGKACLSEKDLFGYSKGKNLYALHMSDIEIFDKPKELGEFKRPCIVPEMPYCPNCKYGYTTFPEDTTKQDIIDGCECKWGCLNTVTRPPQNYMYVEEL
jgi:predicted transcriptional regulator